MPISHPWRRRRAVSMVGVRIASTKTNGPHDRGQGAANDEENRERAAKASGEWGGPDADASGGADARRDVDHAPALARVGPCARAGRAGRTVSRGGGGAGGPQGSASTATHPSSLGGTAATELTFGGRRVQVRRPRVRRRAGGEA